jgi:predicted 2-oxoglutarate/Fe(II)-dependent dioxygenase YbiX
MWRNWARTLSTAVVGRANNTVTFDVSGIRYPMLVRDVEKYPESFFATAIKNEQHLKDSAIKVQRDGHLFRYISAFLVSGALPRKEGKLDLSQEDIEALKKEAVFFNLPALGAECNTAELNGDANANFDIYNTIRKYVASARDLSYCQDTFQCEFPTDDHDPSDLVLQLANLSSPFCVKNQLQFDKRVKPDAPLFKSSTISSLSIPELLEAAQESAFGRGTETIFDPTVRRSWEIPAAELDRKALYSLASSLDCGALSPNLNLELRPYKLVIYQEGGHFDAHRDTVRDKGHIGTLVLVLNSEYTGGELEITHNGQTEVVTAPYSWVAMYGDCLHKINPVTSGTRVSLIFDIYGERARFGRWDFWKSSGGGPQSTEIGVVASNQAAILKGIDKALVESESLVICLGHKYPLCQAVPEFLKGGDRALYELLKDAYDVEVVACTINQKRQKDYPRDKRFVDAALFTSFANPPVLKSYEERYSAAKHANRMKFLIPSPISADSVLDYSPYIEHTGNQSQAESTVYLVAGLQLRRRLKVSTRP